MESESVLKEAQTRTAVSVSPRTESKTDSTTRGARSAAKSPAQPTPAAVAASPGPSSPPRHRSVPPLHPTNHRLASTLPRIVCFLPATPRRPIPTRIPYPLSQRSHETASVHASPAAHPVPLCLPRLYNSPRAPLFSHYSHHRARPSSSIRPGKQSRRGEKRRSRRRGGRDGPYEADRPQVHRRQGAPQAARHQGGEEVGADNRRREEATQVQARDGGAARDPQVPEEHGAANPEAPVPAPGPRDRAGLQDGLAVPEPRRAGAPGGRRGLPRRAVRGHQPLRHPRQACHHHAQGHPARPPHPWRARVSVSSLPYLGGGERGRSSIWNRLLVDLLPSAKFLDFLWRSSSWLRSVLASSVGLVSSSVKTALHLSLFCAVLFYYYHRWLRPEAILLNRLLVN